MPPRKHFLNDQHEKKSQMENPAYYLLIIIIMDWRIYDNCIETIHKKNIIYLWAKLAAVGIMKSI